MPREEKEEYSQDRHGNVRRNLDEFRAREGNVGSDDDTGIAAITSADTGTDQLLYSLPTHVDRAIVTEVWGFNSLGSGDNTFSILSADLDGSNSITSSTRRSVPIVVDSGNTRREAFTGEPFEKAIAVNAEFEGHVGIGLVVDHEEYSEPDTEDTSTPS